MKMLITVLTMALMTQGCSIYKAGTAPPPVAVDKVKVGTTRHQVVSVFGVPKTSEFSQTNQRTDLYEFVDGFDGASKLRIIPYIAADFFTLGLAELILWPMELTVLRGTPGRALVTYDQEEKAQMVMITKQDGSPWYSESKVARDNSGSSVPNME